MNFVDFHCGTIKRFWNFVRSESQSRRALLKKALPCDLCYYITGSARFFSETYNSDVDLFVIAHNVEATKRARILNSKLANRWHGLVKLRHVSINKRVTDDPETASFIYLGRPLSQP